MYGLLNRRSFTLGLTAIVDLVARRWKLGFTVAEAKAAAPPSPPIAPVVPKTFDEFGGVRIDHYDWLRDRRDPRVVAYLDAENAYADARLEPIKPLVDELAAELNGRATPEDVSVPTAYNGYLYERRFMQGAQYPLIVRRKDTPRLRKMRLCSMSARSLRGVRTNISLVHGPSARTTNALPSRSISTVTVSIASLCARSRPARWSMKALPMQPPVLCLPATVRPFLCPQRTDNSPLLSGLATSYRQRYDK